MVGRFDIDEHRGTLQTKHWSAGKTGPVREKRETNIEWIRGLSRENLQFGDRERQIEIAVTNADERIYIQYPGKESDRQESGQRPWDFRPRIQLPNESYGPDLSFGDVWDILFETLESGSVDRTSAARALTALFYRMAFMADHEEIEEFNTRTRVIDVDSGNASSFTDQDYPGLLVYNPPDTVIEDLSAVLPDWGGVSLKAFLHLNDLMAWNEDCKYYYRGTDGGESEWNWPRTGRINNLLTHASILGIITGDLKLSDLLDKFQRSRGVGPVTRDEAEKISGGIIG